VSSETLNRARVSKNTKSSIKTREREREREEEEEEEEEEEALSQYSNRQKTRKKKQKTKKINKEKETVSMMELRKPTKMKVHTFVFYVLFFCKEKIGTRGRRNN
jgi:archaellum component FlaD/FlaE